MRGGYRNLKDFYLFLIKNLEGIKMYYLSLNIHEEQRVKCVYWRT